MMTVGNYDVLPVTIKSFINPSKDEISKSGRRKATTDKEKKKSFPIIVHYLFFRCRRTGLTWKFIGVNRNGEVKFSDGRNDVCDQGGKPNRMVQSQLATEVSRLIGSNMADIVIATMFANVQKGSDMKSEIDGWNATIGNAIATVKATRSLSGIMNAR